MFTDSERAIFRYKLPDGTPRAADPLHLRRRLSRLLGGDTAGVVKAFNSDDDATAEQAYHRLAHAVCVAFDLGALPLDPATGIGLVQAQWLPIWNDFQRAIANFAPPPATLPTSAPATVLTGTGGSPIPNTSA